jgi:hypothetical protein
MVWGPTLALTVLVFFKKMPRLMLDAEGFEFENFLGRARWRWADVAEFSSCLFLVVFRAPTQAGASRWANFNRWRCFLGSFGLGVRGLADLLAGWRVRALSQPWSR